ncbi:hypothetical protein HHI36_013830 [Cryptolaemus montrouzieri]|uniref:Peptidase S1 domain-containing protein n=1 Tax=Cryptolaemus montrouzieri TaxID=559131 RepID=A0ABD2N115_9CUCU
MYNIKLTNLFCLLNTVLMFVCVSYGQEIAQKQCERYGNGMDRVEIRNTVPNSIRRRPVRHIVGGTKSSPAEFPFMVALGYTDGENIRWECGGALISENFVLTAAHCAQHRELGFITMARLGTIDLKIPLGQEPAQDIEVKSLHTHPGYSAPSMYNDIALVELRSSVRFTSSVFPACLHTDSGLDNVAVTAMGWGRLDFAGDQSTDLMKVTLSLIKPEECREIYKSESSNKLKTGINSSTQICAGSDGKTARDTCQGDSGGPLQMQSGNKHIIVGITSFGKACGVANTPGVYTRVSAFVPWLEPIVWK